MFDDTGGIPSEHMSRHPLAVQMEDYLVEQLIHFQVGPPTGALHFERVIGGKTSGTRSESRPRREKEEEGGGARSGFAGSRRMAMALIPEVMATLWRSTLWGNISSSDNNL